MTQMIQMPNVQQSRTSIASSTDTIATASIEAKETVNVSANVTVTVQIPTDAIKVITVPRSPSEKHKRLS